jgi:hypothetical protein
MLTYALSPARRLINETSASQAAEEFMVGVLKKMGLSSDFTARLERMLTDRLIAYA